MKVITKDKAYVQLSNLAKLCDSEVKVPASVFRTIVGENGLTITDKNKYKFMEFTKEEDVEFFKKQTWMVDYEEVKDKSEYEINRLLSKIAEEAEKYLREYKNYPYEEQKEHEDIHEKYKLLEFKFFSLRDILYSKQETGRIDMPKTLKYETVEIRNIFKNKKTGDKK